MTGFYKRQKFKFVRGIFTAGSAFVLLLLAVSFAGAQICAVPGKDGPQTISGVVNTYYPSPTTATASGTSIPVGSVSNIGSSLTPIAAGDLLLIIQVQDALINSSNNSNYGGGNGTGRGFTSGNAGFYEYAVATNSVGTGGGTIITQQSLSRTYQSAAATSSRGRRTYQVVRIPQYSAATISGTLNAASWDGTSGGIVAFDVAGTLNMGGGTINASGRGFRGGLGITLTGGSGSNTDYRGNSTNGTGGSKGEGIAGTPRRIWDGSFGIDNGTEGYPNGSFLRGAPGNAGGGGTDGSPSVDNGQNSGGGGGGNGGIGGVGGNSWSSNLTIGGIGGDDISAAANRIIFGGGGGAGTTNNTAGDTASGGIGGGIVIIRAGAVSGTGTITANGGNAPNSNPNCCGDGAGGGGGGGSIMITAANPSGLSGITTSARGGKGGDTLVAAVPHGPGGGGAGGVIFSNGSLGSTSVLGGVNGTTTPSATFPDPAYGAQPGQSGIINVSTNPASVNGTPSGADCVPDLTVTKSTTTPVVTNLITGTTAIYSITVSNASNRASATQLNISDALPQPVANGFTYASTVLVTLTGGATRPSTANPAAGAINPLWSQFTIPGGGSVVLTFNVNIAASVPSGTYQNPATATYLDPARTVSSGTRSVNYDSASTTNEDVRVVGPPNISLVKNCTVPANCTTASQLPNTELTYKIDFSNTGGLSASNLIIVDGIPPNTDFKLGSATVSAGTTGLTFVIEYSSDYVATNPTAATWSYTPVSQGGGASAGFDRLVKAVRWRVTAGSLSQISPNNAGSVSFVSKIR
ncbi:MAG: hypothetical protein R2681_04250 [Pyrinomonadaceae bacterium]